MSKNNLGIKLKKAREAVNLTQEEVGHAIGVTGVTIMRYEKGRRQPRFEQLEKLADILDMPLRYLLEDEEGNVDSFFSKENLVNKYFLLLGYEIIFPPTDDSFFDDIECIFIDKKSDSLGAVDRDLVRTVFSEINSFIDFQCKKLSSSMLYTGSYKKWLAHHPVNSDFFVDIVQNDPDKQ